MHPDEIRARLVRLCVETLGVHPEQVGDATLLEDIASDSLEVTQTIMEIEQVFSIEISDKDSEALTTFGDIVGLVVDITKNSPR